MSSPPIKVAKPVPQRDLLGHLILVAPVFLFYHLGLLFSPQAANGADIVSWTMGYLAGVDVLVYLLVLLGLCVGYVLWLRALRKKRKFRPGRFPQVVAEGVLYALVMGPLASLLVSQLPFLRAPALSMGPFDRLVASAGAGFYEELIFRLAGIWLLLQLGRTWKISKWLSTAVAITGTSLLFSLVHYLGPGGESFALVSFSFRFILGSFLAAIYLWRGFAQAVYAHFLYDVYVMCVLMP